ncbi:hypothetical protein BURPS1655_B0007 [Burkholderia pseudomallei 1655]|nr:hypothetical protein BURPS1655_B0007 [Burkholderia pseudomallei 1655]
MAERHFAIDRTRSRRASANSARTNSTFTYPLFSSELKI